MQNREEYAPVDLGDAVTVYDTFSWYVAFNLSSDCLVDDSIAVGHWTGQSEERINTLLNDHQNELSYVFCPLKQTNKQTNRILLVWVSMFSWSSSSAFSLEYAPSKALVQASIPAYN